MNNNNVYVGQTSFPLKADPSQKGNLSYFFNGNSNYRLLDGPPYANGAPHLGHVLNKHLKDSVARANNALGYNVEWRPGWDCHGLPLEVAVEKMGFNRNNPVEFVEKARDFALSQVEVQKNVFMEQGWMADWENPYMTCQNDKEAATLEVLAHLLERNLLDVRYVAVPWCSYCSSTVSQAEQEDMEWTRESWVVPFNVTEGNSLVKKNDAFLTWTTTPWTLPLHRHLVVNADTKFVCLEKNGFRAWVSEETSQNWVNKLNAVLLNEVVFGRDLEGMKYSTPWTNSTVCLDEMVLSNAGTGFLHAVPGLSEMDSELANKYNWEKVQYLTMDGKVQNSPSSLQNGTYAGHPSSYNFALEEYSSSVWFLSFSYTSDHTMCWRHKKPLLTRYSRQVFLKLGGEVKKRAFEMMDKMSFTPENSKNRLVAFMENRNQDWCLSRQRTWGVPMALVLDKTTQKPHNNAVEWMRQTAEQFRKNGVKSWWDGSARPQNLPENTEVVEDVLDVWFDSACVPQFMGSADCVVEGTDQHRGWFQSCLWLAAACGEKLPFKRVVTHGFVMADKKNKLSKSTGGDKKDSKMVDWKTLPTDVVRIWSLSGAEGADKMWSKETTDMAAAWVFRWRGVVRFLLSNCLEENHTNYLNQVEVWDKYWLEKLDNVVNNCLQNLSNAYCGTAVSELSQFAEEFSSVCLQSWKDRLYCASENTDERKALDCVLKQALKLWLKVLSVVTPRMYSDTLEHLPLNYNKFEEVNFYTTLEEKEQVEVLLSWRKKLAKNMEEMSKNKVKSGQRVVYTPVVFNNWGSQLMADALDVGQVKLGNLLSLEVSNDCLCPRCRRSQEKFVGDVCNYCFERMK